MRDDWERGRSPHGRGPADPDGPYGARGPRPQRGVPDGLLVGFLAFLLGATVLVWSATNLAGRFARGAWPEKVSFGHTPPAVRHLAGEPHDVAGAWPDTPPDQLSGYGLFWGLFIGQLLILIVLTIFVMGTVARWRAVRRARRESGGTGMGAGMVPPGRAGGTEMGAGTVPPGRAGGTGMTGGPVPQGHAGGTEVYEAAAHPPRAGGTEMSGGSVPPTRAGGTEFQAERAGGWEPRAGGAENSTPAPLHPAGGPRAENSTPVPAHPDGGPAWS